MIPGVDINKLIDAARASYGKKEQGLARQISSGADIVSPDSDDDFVVWKGGSHWQSLLGFRGIPYGKIIQIAGRPDSGKSTHAMCFMKYAQEQSNLVILWDAEQKFSKKRFQKMGGDTESLVCIRNNAIVGGVRHVARIVNAAKMQNPQVRILIVWDSVGASVNATEDDDENDDYSKQPGVSAKEVTYAIKKINRLLVKGFDVEAGKHTIAALPINQVYANIGSHGDTEKGGQEIAFLSSVILQLSRKQDLTHIVKGEKMKYGILTRARVKKNHLFDGDECLAELELVVSAAGIQLASEVKSNKDIVGWDSSEGEEA